MTPLASFAVLTLLTIGAGAAAVIAEAVTERIAPARREGRPEQT